MDAGMADSGGKLTVGSLVSVFHNLVGITFSFRQCADNTGKRSCAPLEIRIVARMAFLRPAFVAIEETHDFGSRLKIKKTRTIEVYMVLEY